MPKSYSSSNTAFGIFLIVIGTIIFLVGASSGAWFPPLVGDPDSLQSATWVSFIMISFICGFLGGSLIGVGAAEL